MSKQMNEMAAEQLTCCVVFLDDTSASFDVPKKARGQALLDVVFRQLDLVERDFFGLKIFRSSDKTACLRWLDPRKLIRKQVTYSCPFFHNREVRWCFSNGGLCFVRVRFRTVKRWSSTFESSSSWKTPEHSFWKSTPGTSTFYSYNVT